MPPHGAQQRSGDAKVLTPTFFSFFSAVKAEKSTFSVPHKVTEYYDLVEVVEAAEAIE